MIQFQIIRSLRDGSPARLHVHFGGEATDGTAALLSGQIAIAKARLRSDLASLPVRVPVQGQGLQALAKSNGSDGLLLRGIEFGLSPETITWADFVCAQDWSNLKSVGGAFTVLGFGTGGSTLATVKRARVAKIEVSSRSGLLPDADGDLGVSELAILNATLSMAQAMGIAVVAGLIETQAQLARVRELGFSEYLSAEHLHSAA